MDPVQEKLNKIREQQRKAAKAYYARKYIVKETMTEEEKDAVERKIKERNEISKVKYAANKEYYKEKVKQCMERKKREDPQTQTS